MLYSRQVCLSRIIMGNIPLAPRSGWANAFPGCGVREVREVDRLIWVRRWLYGGMAETMGLATNASGMPMLMGLAFVFGIVHALMPGHGKSVLVSYHVGREGRPMDGLISGSLLALIHVGSAIVFVAAGVAVISRVVAAGGRAPGFERASAALIALTLFLPSGISKAMGFTAFSASLAAKGLPYADAWAAAAVAIEVLDPIALILGIAPRWSSLALIAFVIMATATTHRYWEFADATARRAQEINFYKNAGVLAGLLFYFVRGAGASSISGRRANRAAQPVAA